MADCELRGEVLEQGITLIGNINSVHGCIYIGQEITTSATTIPDYVELSKDTFLCDTPGFGDDRGAWRFE